MIYIRPLFFAIFALLLCLPAQAQDQVTGFKGRNFNLPTPAGFCVPNATNAFAQRYTALLKNSGNTVVKLAADCRQLRAAGNIYDYLGYYYATSSEEEVLDGDVAARRKALCDDARAQTQDALNDVQSVVDRTARELNQNLGSTNPKYLGVLADDAHGCYAGILSPVRLGSNHYILNIDVLFTVIHARSFFAALYAKYDNAAGAAKELAREQALAAELDAKNPD